MKKRILVIIAFLSLFVVLSRQTEAEATVTNGKVQYYYESSTAISNSSANSTSEPSSSTTADSHHSTTSHGNQTDRPTAPSQKNNVTRSGITRFLQTNDQRNIFLSIIGLLILVIAFWGWRLVKNRRKMK
ncbi:LPXTG cell wall anchor domain-containing protein [Enterococcus gilvus]|uniref:LPXTG cell wall anchor domain-containing protein n=1 Tax=Enterococcus gilvus TaxID=160453 RepID=UPI003ED8BCD1